MNQLAFIAIAALFALMIVQTVLAILFVQVLRSVRPPRLQDRTWPGVLIVLPLRGADACLPRTIHDLLNLDYPDYELRIVIDSPQDPAWKLVEETLRGVKANNVSTSSIKLRRVTCGLQCCAVTEALVDLPRGISVIVTVDGDVRVHAQFLKQLVAPLDDPRVGLSFGNRWFTPRDSQTGSWVRYLWNAAAVIPMYFNGIPWGGCCAIRRDALDRSLLTNVWQRSIVHDAPIKVQLARIGMQVRFVPELMIANADSCDLRFAHDFIKRQMLWTKLYHPNYTGVLVHAMATILTMLTLAGLTLVACMVGNLSIALISMGGLLTYMLNSVLLLRLIDSAVRHVFLQQLTAQIRSWEPPWLKMPALVIITQLVYASAVLRATFARRVSWRGIQYAIKGPFHIERLNDSSFTQEQVHGEKLVSL